MRGVSGDPGDAAVLDPDQDAAVTVADPAERLPYRRGVHAVAWAGRVGSATSAATSGRTLAAAEIPPTRFERRLDRGRGQIGFAEPAELGAQRAVILRGRVVVPVMLAGVAGSRDPASGRVHGDLRRDQVRVALPGHEIGQDRRRPVVHADAHPGGEVAHPRIGQRRGGVPARTGRPAPDRERDQVRNAELSVDDGVNRLLGHVLGDRGGRYAHVYGVDVRGRDAAGGHDPVDQVERGHRPLAGGEQLV